MKASAICSTDGEPLTFTIVIDDWCTPGIDKVNYLEYFEGYLYGSDEGRLEVSLLGDSLGSDYGILIGSYSGVFSSFKMVLLKGQH